MRRIDSTTFARAAITTSNVGTIDHFFKTVVLLLCALCSTSSLIRFVPVVSSLTIQRHSNRYRNHQFAQQERRIDLPIKSNNDNIVVPSRRFTSSSSSTTLYASTNSHNDPDATNTSLYKEKFGWKQRIASVQSLLIGAIVGSIATTPISFVHCLSTIKGFDHVLAQWEYNTDMAAICGSLFAIIYRYVIRTTDTTNPQLQQGFISSMILIRTVPQISIPYYCTPIPLNCNSPPFYFYILDINVIQQFLWCGLESSALFVSTAIVMDYMMNKGYIARFPG